MATHDPGSPGARRQALLAAVKAAPGSADAWRAWLGYEEAAAGGATSHGLGGSDSGRLGLYHMYLWATQLVPRSKSAAYLQLWLGYARQQWCGALRQQRQQRRRRSSQLSSPACMPACMLPPPPCRAPVPQGAQP